MSANQHPLRVLGIAGSLREASYNRRLVRLAAELVPEGVEYVELDGLRDVEPFDEDLELDGTPPGAARFQQAINEADAVLVVTPEYNASIPGQLKNAFDWASRAATAPHNEIARSPMYGVPVAVVSTSTGQFGGVWARDELLKSLRTQGARAVEQPKVAVPNAATAFTDDGRLRNEATVASLRELVAALVEQARLVRDAAARAAERQQSLATTV